MSKNIKLMIALGAAVVARSGATARATSSTIHVMGLGGAQKRLLLAIQSGCPHDNCRNFALSTPPS